FLHAVPQAGLDAVFQTQQAKKDPVPPEIFTFLRRRFTSSSPDSLTAIAQRLLDAPDRIDELAKSGVDVAVVRGAGDDEWPHADQQRMAERLGLDVVVIPDSAHSPAVENTEETARVLSNVFGG